LERRDFIEPCYIECNIFERVGHCKNTTVTDGMYRKYAVPGVIIPFLKRSLDEKWLSLWEKDGSDLPDLRENISGIVAFFQHSGCVFCKAIYSIC
jgi:hypothetical protein